MNFVGDSMAYTKHMNLSDEELLRLALDSDPDNELVHELTIRLSHYIDNADLGKTIEEVLDGIDA